MPTITEELGFKKKHIRVREEAGTVRMTVKRKTGGDAPSTA